MQRSSNCWFPFTWFLIATFLMANEWIMNWKNTEWKDADCSYGTFVEFLWSEWYVIKLNIFSSCSSCALLFMFCYANKRGAKHNIVFRVCKFSVKSVMIRFWAFHILGDTCSLLLLYFLPTVQMHASDISCPKLCKHFLIPLSNYMASQWCFLIFNISPILRYLVV